MKNFNFLEKLWEHSRTLRRVGMVLVMCLITITQMWAWYLPGTINGKERWGDGDNNMNDDNQITFYAVKPGTYYCKLSDGSKTYNGSWTDGSGGDGLGIYYEDGQIKLVLTKEKDVYVKYDGDNKVWIQSFDPSYHIKYNWAGTGWAWSKAMTNNGDGTYSVIGRYNSDLGASTGWRYRMYSTDDDSDGGSQWHGGFDSGSVEEGLSGGDYCVYTYNPSDDKLTIRKCNSVAPTSHIYFDNTETNWSTSNRYLVIGRPTYMNATSPYMGLYSMSQVSNTKLWYYEYTSSAYSDADYYAVVGHSSSKSSDNVGAYAVSNGTFSKYTGLYASSYNMSNTVNYIITPSSGSNGASISIHDWNTYASALNSTQTIKYSVSWDGNNTYSELTSGVTGKNTPAQIQISAYKFVDGTYNSVTNSSNSQTISANQNSTVSKSVPAAYTGATTLTYSSVGTHFDWIGWYDAANGGSVVSSPYYPKTAGTVYARLRAKKYTVTYNANGGTCGTSSAQATAFTSVTLPTPTWSGYSFDGWYSNGEKIGNAGDSYTPTADITLYAKWTDNTTGKIFSYIDGNYGDKWKAFDGSGWATSNQSSKSYTFTHATTKIQYRIINAEWENKSNIINNFAKWKNGTTTMSVVIPTDTIAQVKILYGAYDKKNILTINSTNTTAVDNALENGLTSAQVASKLKEVTLSNKEGTLTFGAATGNIYIARVVATITGYKIHYDKGANGTGTISAGTKTHGSNFTLSSSTFSRDGYTQTGWSTTDGGTKAYNMGGTYSTDAAITLYPYWTPTSYTLSYDLDGGNVASDNPTSYTIESSDITLNNPTKNGYIFAGWTGTDLAEATTTVTIAAGSTGDRSYTATWSCKTPVFSTNLSTDEVEYTVGASATSLIVEASANSGTIAYQWYSNDENNYDTPNALANCTTATYKPSTEDEGTTYYFCKATNAVSPCTEYVNSNITPVTVAAAPTLTALEDGVGYTPANMLPDGYTISTSWQYVGGLSENTKFEIIGDASSEENAKSETGIVEIKTTTKEDEKFTIDEVTYDAMCFFKGGSGSHFTDNMPTVRAVKFMLPEAGSLYIIGAGSNIKLIKEGQTEATSVTFSSNEATINSLSSGTYYLYATGSSCRIAYIRFDEAPACTDPGLAFASATKTTTFCDATPTNALTNTYGVAVSYASSDEAVATVASNGALTIKKAGTTTITASSIEQTVSAVTYCADEASYTLTVNASVAAGLSYASTSVSKDANASDFTNELTNSHGLTVTYESSDPTVATVNASTGLVDVKAAGTTTITASSVQQKVSSTCYLAGEATYTLTVNAVYTVTYEYNGADGGLRPASATASSVTLPSPEKDGYDFDGWYKTDGTKVDDGGESYSPTADITLYARWTGECESGGGGGGSTVTYDFEPVLPVTTDTYMDTYFTHSTESSTYHSYSVATTSGDISAGTNQGTYFLAGATGSTANKKATYKTKTSFSNIQSITFDEVSSDNSQPKYTVKIIEENSTSHTVLDAVDHQTILGKTGTETWKNGYSIDVSENGYSGYVQFEVATTSGSGKQYGLDNITIEYGSGGSSSACNKVLYHGNGAESGYIYDPNVYDDGDDPEVLGNTTGTNGVAFVKDGYTFQGWANGSAHAAAGTVDFTAASIAAGTAVISGIGDDVDLYAVWAAAATTYTVTYANGGATGDVPVDASSPYEEGDEVTILGKGSLAKTGYSFGGWNDGSTDYDADDTFTMPAEDVTLTAQWTEDTHTVSVAAGAHGTVSPSSVSGVGIATASGNITATPSTGYSFNGWTLPSGVTAASTYTASSNPISINATADDKTITATWTTVSYTITYNLNSGSLDGSEKTSYNIETEDYDLPTPTYSGHVFQGWYTNEDFTSDRVYTLAEGSTGNKNYYAKWADGLTINWTITKVSSKLYKGGTGYTVTAVVDDADWDASGSANDLVLSASDGVTLSNITKSVDGTSGKAQVVANFSVAGDVDGDKIYFTLSVPAAGDYSAIEDEKEVELDDCPGGGSGGTSVYKFQVKTGLGSSASNIDSSVKDASTYMSVLDGGTIPMSLSGNGNIQTKSDSALCLHSTSGLLTPTLTSPKEIQRGDIIKYRSTSNEIRLMVSTTYTATTDVTMPAGNKMVVTSSSMIGQSALNMTQKSSDAEIKYFEIYRPGEVLFYAEVNNGISTGNIGSGTDETEQTAGAVASGHNLSYISGGKLYTKARSAGYVKGATNEIQLTDGASGTYIRVALDKALAEGDIILVNSIAQTYPLGITTSATYSTAIVGPYYVIPAESGMIGKKNIYLWKNSSNSNLRTVAVVRPGGSGGVATSLAWSSSLADKATVNKNDVDADFQYYASPTPANAGGPISYSSSDESVATVSSNGTVHIINNGTTTITASMSAYGCYSPAEPITYSLVVANTCADEPGTIVDNDGNAIAGNKVTRGACETLTLKLTGYSEGASIKWYKDGDEIAGATNATYAVPTGQSGVYSAKSTLTGDSHCSLSSTNSITVTTAGSIDPTIFADEFTVKQGHWFGYRLMEINAGESVSVKTAPTGWVNLSDFKITTKNNIVSIEGNVSRSTGDKTLTLTITNECSGSTDKDFTIHEIAETAKPTVAWIATGDNKGGDYLAAVKASESTNTDLYDHLKDDYIITPRNCYWTTNEADLVKEYSQYDLIILTDYPNSGTCPSGKSGKSNSYTNAIGLLIDHKPIMTFEAFVAGCPNWGIASDPQNTKATQTDLTLLCNADEIFGTSGKFAAGEAIKVTSASSGQALQGFPVASSPDFVFIGKITDSDSKTYVACCERQHEIAARMMVFGLNSSIMSSLTEDGKTMVKGFIEYLLKDDPASVPDCSVIFNGGGGDDSWYTTDNWEAGLLPDQYASVRIDAPCVVPANEDPAKAGRIKIHVTDMNSGSLTIAPQGCMIVEKGITRIEGDAYTVHMPTEPEDLIIQSNETAQGALIFDNEKGETQATVKLYSKGRKEGSYQFQYFASPFMDISSWAFGDAYIYTHDESLNPEWTQLSSGEPVYAFQGLSLTADGGAATYPIEGTLASTESHTYNLTYTGSKANNKKGTNVVGNSWTAPIQITRIDNEDFDNPSKFEGIVYIYNAGRDAEQGVGQSTNADTSTPGVWQAIPIETAKTGAWTGSRQIPAFQAFQIKVNSDAALTLNYDKHVRQAPTEGDDNLNEPLHAPRRGTVRAEEVEVLRLCVEDNTANYRAYIYLCEGDEFTENRDRGWEAQQSAGDGKAGKLYAIDPRNDYMMSIARESLEGTPVGFLCGQATEYTITFNETMGYYYLNDMETQQSTLIQEGESYSFTTTKGNHPNRFIISAIPFDKPGIATGVTDLDAEAPKVQKVIYNDKLYIIRGGKVFSADGQLVK